MERKGEFWATIGCLPEWIENKKDWRIKNDLKDWNDEKKWKKKNKNN